jgi:heptosyltransferase-1
MGRASDPAAAPKPGASPRILIIRLSAIGDVVMASALIPVLRRAHPQAYLAWLVEPPAQDLLKHNRALDEVIVWPRHRWRQLARSGRLPALYRQVRDFIRQLRRRRFDIVLDLQGLLKSALWAYLTGAGERVGLGSREGSALLMTRVVDSPPNDPRIGSEYFRLAKDLELSPGDFPMDVAVCRDDEQAVGERLKALRLRARYAVFCPFTTRPQKHWVDERWADLARRLAQAQSLPALILGSGADTPAARRIHELAPTCTEDLTGRTTIGQAAAAIRGASLLVGVDTGLTHLGIALGVPTLALFGSTRPYLDPAMPQAAVLYHRLPCSPCRRHPTCNGAYTCMRSIDVEQVLATAQRLLSAAEVRR